MSMKKRIVYLTIIAILAISLTIVYSKYSRLQTAMSSLELETSQDGTADEDVEQEMPDQGQAGSGENLNDTVRYDDDPILKHFRPITLAEWQLRSYPFTAEEIVKNLVKRTDLIPYQPILGGTMFFVPEKVVLLTHNWAIAYFEDGHIQGYVLVKYGVDQQNQLTWDVIDSWTPNGVDYTSKALGDKEVVQLLVKAFDRHWSTRFDYNEAEDAIFVVDGTEYMYLSKKYDTEQKMLAYLQEVYTAEISRQLFASYGFKMHEGRLYHQYGELGTLNIWHKAEPTLLYHKQDRALYNVQIPVSDEYEEKQVEIVYLIDRGWRVNTVIDY